MAFEDIDFVESKTRQDGGASSDGGHAIYHQRLGSLQRPPNIDVMSLIRPSQLQDARRFIDGLHSNIIKRKDPHDERAKNTTEILCLTVQQVEKLFFIEI